MSDRTEQAVRALPPFLQRRMAHLVLRGWKIECNHLRSWATDGHPSDLLPVSWTARCHRAEAIVHLHPYVLNIYSASTLLTLLDQMVGIVEVMSGDATVGS